MMSASALIAIAQTIVLLGAAITGAYIIGRAVRSAYRFAKRLELIHSTILLELLPNGGSSIKDKIDGFDVRLGTVESVLGIEREIDVSP